MRGACLSLQHAHHTHHGGCTCCFMLVYAKTACMVYTFVQSQWHSRQWGMAARTTANHKLAPCPASGGWRGRGYPVKPQNARRVKQQQPQPQDIVVGAVFTGKQVGNACYFYAIVIKGYLHQVIPPSFPSIGQWHTFPFRCRGKYSSLDTHDNCKPYSLR